MVRNIGRCEISAGRFFMWTPLGRKLVDAAYSFEKGILWVPAAAPTQFAVAEADDLDPGVIVTVDGVNPHIAHLWMACALRS